MKYTTKHSYKVKEIIDKAFNEAISPFTSITSNFNPKTQLYEVVIR